MTFAAAGTSAGDRRQRHGRFALTWVLATTLAGTATAAAQPEATADVEAAEVSSETVAPDSSRAWETALNGYLDVGFAWVQGDGTSFAPGDTRAPADYVTDTFATAVNSRGDVASIATGRSTGGFLPRDMGIGGRPSFLFNSLTQDLRVNNANESVLLFARVQFLPRYGAAGNETRLWVEQAFTRLVPSSALELALTVGKFDSVFGIEYLDNPANVRVGITPSLIARYTTGQCLGAKLFYRFHLPSLASSFSFNVSASNGATLVEPLQPVEISATGRPVFAGRVGYELALARFAVKLGGSALRGPRNDQLDRSVHQTNWGIDGRIYLGDLILAGEWIYLEEEPGSGSKYTGAGVAPEATGFEIRGWYAQAAYRLALGWGALTAVAPYARVERRRAQFESFPLVETRRLTVGLHLDLWSSLALKGEWLLNREAAGAIPVANDVRTISLVSSW